MKIAILSDLHLEMAGPLKGVETIEGDCDVIVLAGDISTGRFNENINVANRYAETYAKPVLIVSGNHEFYYGDIDLFYEEMKAAKTAPWVQFLQRKGVRINDVNFFGATLWTNYKIPTTRLFSENMHVASRFMNDFRLISAGGNYNDKFTPENAAERHAKDIGWIFHSCENSNTAKNVVITHHSPVEASVAPKYHGDVMNGSFVSDYDKFFTEGDFKADLWIHGHTHEKVDVTLGKTRFVCNPKGYRSEASYDTFKPLIVEI